MAGRLNFYRFSLKRASGNRILSFRSVLQRTSSRYTRNNIEPFCGEKTEARFIFLAFQRTMIAWALRMKWSIAAFLLATRAPV
jgi:hypothetical protein